MPENDADSGCPVCMEKFTPNRSQCKMRCGHGICSDCITRLTSPHCPMCRAPVWGGKPSQSDDTPPSGAGSVERQIAEDELLARELSSGDSGIRVRPPSAAAIIPLPLHFNNQRTMTFSSVDFE